MKHAMRLLCALAIVLASLGLWAQQDQMPPADTAPDNSQINQRDRTQGNVTADQQSNNRIDIELTRQIRRALVQDKSLSTYGHNVKIVSQNGVVTLRGPVKSDEEKQAIAAKAVEVVGSADKVQNELEVAGNKASGKPSPDR